MIKNVNYMDAARYKGTDGEYFQTFQHICSNNANSNNGSNNYNTL